MDSLHVIICAFTQDKIDAINQYGINIHFDNLDSTIIRVDNETEANGVLVNSIPNRYYMTFDYIVKFNNLLNRLVSG